MNKTGRTYLLYIAVFLVNLFVPSLTAHSQDVLKHENYCEEALQMNLESATARNTDRQLALELAEQAFALAGKHACSQMEALALRNIGIIYFFRGTYLEAEEYFNKSLFIYESIDDSTGISSVYNNLGLLFSRQADYKNAFDFFAKSRDLSETIGDTEGTATALLNITHVYFYQGMYSDAIASTRRAQKIFEALNDSHSILLCQNNIAAIYETQGLYYEALETLEQALQSAVDLDDDASRSMILHNIGMIYYELGNQHKALDYYTNSLLIKIDLDDKAGISLCLSNMGSALRMLGRLDESNAHFTQALKIDQELGNDLGIAIQFAQIAGNLLDKKEPLSAIDYYTQSNEIAYNINALPLLRDNYMHLVKAYLDVNNYDQAYNYMRKYISFRDDMIIPHEELEGYEVSKYLPGGLPALLREVFGIESIELLFGISVILNLVLLFLLWKKR
jgi:tetratricopeptide (TPR) repeat protein